MELILLIIMILMCGENLVKAKSIDDVMNLKIFDGKTLDEIFEEITDFDY